MSLALFNPLPLVRALLVLLSLSLCSLPATLVSGQSASTSTFHVTGYLSGADFLVTYDFEAGCVPYDHGFALVSYFIDTVLGTRSFTNTTTNVTEVANIVRSDIIGLHSPDYLLYPYNTVPATNLVVTYDLIDNYGIAFTLDRPSTIVGGYGNNFTTIFLIFSASVSRNQSVPLSNAKYIEYPGGQTLIPEAMDLITDSFLTANVGAGAASSSSSSGSAAPISVLGDPQFVGLRGQSFQVHGIDGEVYSVIVDHDVFINARFRFLSSGRCPAIEQPNNCWSHPGSYVGEVGVRTAEGGRLHVVSGGWDEGFGSVTLNGHTLAVGSNITQHGLTVHVTSSYSLSLTVGNFELTLDSSDRFLNIASVRVLDWSRLSSHGLLGQTWRTDSGGKAGSPIEGEVDDYAERNGDLFGSDLVYGVEAAVKT